MNATEQRTHRTVTASLEARIAVLEDLVAQLMQNQVALYRAISEERTQRLQRADAQDSAPAGATGT